MEQSTSSDKGLRMQRRKPGCNERLWTTDKSACVITEVQSTMCGTHMKKRYREPRLRIVAVAINLGKPGMCSKFEGLMEKVCGQLLPRITALPDHPPPDTTTVTHPKIPIKNLTNHAASAPSPNPGRSCIASAISISGFRSA